MTTGRPSLRAASSFASRARAACILGDNPARCGGSRSSRRSSAFAERTARDDSFGVGQRQRHLRRIDQAQQVVMLRLGREGREGLPADGQEDPAGLFRQGGDGGGDIGDMASSRRPRRPPTARAHSAISGIPASRSGRDGVAAHLGGKGMGRVDDMGDPFGPQVVHEARQHHRSRRSASAAAAARAQPVRPA